MNQQIAQAISKSSEDFLRFVWPAIGAPFGDVVPVETVTANQFAAELDRRAGIDVWLIGVGGDMRGLASRVQWTDSSYDTFTVRVRSRYGRATEYHKRKAEIASNGASISPYYFVQGYVSKDRTHLVAAAIARMRDVIKAVELDMGRLMPANGDGSQGFAVPWHKLQELNASIQIWRATEGDL
jgi:hypothetical protein